MAQLGVSGTEFRGEPVDALLAAADRVGVDGVEVWHPENFSATGDRSTVDRLARWRGRVAAVSCGVEVVQASDPAEPTARLLAALEVAAELGAPLVNTYYGAPGYRDDRRSGEVFLRRMEPVLARAERLGVMVSLENEFNAFGWDAVAGDLTRRPDALAELVASCPSDHLKITFDPANFYCAGVEPFPHAYQLLAPHIGQIHVKDVRSVDLRRADGDDGHWRRFGDYERTYRTTELGSGAVNWTGLLDRLAADGYPGPLVLEPHANPDRRDAAFDQAVAWFRGVRSIHSKEGQPRVQ